jgi:hypothetical protein
MHQEDAMRSVLSRFAFASLLCVACEGCTLFPAWMQPASLWKLNQQEPGGRDSMYFSIADPPREAPQEALPEISGADFEPSSP